MPTAVQYEYFLVLGFTTKTPAQLGNATVLDIYYTLLCIGSLFRYKMRKSIIDETTGSSVVCSIVETTGLFVTFSSPQGSSSRIAL